MMWSDIRLIKCVCFYSSRVFNCRWTLDPGTESGTKIAADNESNSLCNNGSDGKVRFTMYTFRMSFYDHFDESGDRSNWGILGRRNKTTLLLLLRPLVLLLATMVGRRVVGLIAKQMVSRGFGQPSVCVCVCFWAQLECWLLHTRYSFLRRQRITSYTHRGGPRGKQLDRKIDITLE
jgi:hypothetical protein